MKPVATRRFALLGDPVAHSKSPAMHAAAYRALQLPYTYEAIRATPEDLARLVDELRAKRFDGFNVTVPHKRRILDHVDVIDTTAKVAAAANTIVRRDDGTIAAYNTDAPALAKELRLLAPDLGGKWSTASGIVLGTGGAARSAVIALAMDLGVARVTVRGRSRDDAKERAAIESQLADIARAAHAEIAFEPLAPNAHTEEDALVVVQATSLGMQGAGDGDIAARAIGWSDLPPSAVAIDVVYAPKETPFLRAAGAHGIRATNGIGMLVRQGALAIELWLGVPAPYNAMLTALV
jgi:shikimate dehydrogenase